MHEISVTYLLLYSSIYLTSILTLVPHTCSIVRICLCYMLGCYLGVLLDLVLKELLGHLVLKAPAAARNIVLQTSGHLVFEIIRSIVPI